MIPRLSRFGKWNTLRNQILIVFLVVMAIVLICVSIMTFTLVSALLKKNTEKQIQQTAVQANGRFETLYRQIDMLTTQVVTHEYVQQLLQEYEEGRPVRFNQRQSLMKIMNMFQGYSDGIHSFELYTADYRRLVPLDEANLLNRIDKKWLIEADKAKGGLVWIGKDPKAPTLFLAIRRVSLIDRWYSNGGYLLVRINQNYFQLKDPPQTGQEKAYLILVDQNFIPIVSNYQGDYRQVLRGNQKVVTIDERDYIAVKQSSELTGWTVIILSPVRALTEGISVLRFAILLSGIVGFLMFLLFAFLLSTMITRPIFRLTKTMQLARLGRLAPIPEMSATVEISELNKTYNQMVEHINYLIQVVYEKELLRSRTELKALQAQINPHFLFNTLDALYWSLEEKGEEELAELVVAMSELFRYTISSPENGEWVLLKEELKHLERYLKIMKMRFGEPPPLLI